MEYQYKDIKLNYEVIGNGKPIVILHGLLCDLHLMTSCLEPVFSNHNTEYKRYYIDLPGMGKSGGNLSYATSDKILEVLTGFIKEFIHERFLVMGQSYGGYLARGILAEFTEQVDGMMLLCPVIIPQWGKRTLPAGDIKFEDLSFLTRDEFRRCGKGIRIYYSVACR